MSDTVLYVRIYSVSTKHALQTLRIRDRETPDL